MYNLAHLNKQLFGISNIFIYLVKVTQSMDSGLHKNQNNNMGHLTSVFSRTFLRKMWNLRMICIITGHLTLKIQLLNTSFGNINGTIMVMTMLTLFTNSDQMIFLEQLHKETELYNKLTLMKQYLFTKSLNFKNLQVKD